MKTAIYPGTFDPITYGHIDVIKKSLLIFDRLIVATSDNENKNYYFSIDERVDIINYSLFKELKLSRKKIKVISFNNLTIELCKKYNSNVIIRGLRAVSDFEYEFQLATMNRSLAPDIESIFLTPKESLIYVSSSLIKEISDLKGDVSKFVHPKVEQALKAKLET